MKTGKILPLLMLVSAMPAQAYQFHTSDDLSVSLDTTLTYGGMWRLDDPDPALLRDPNLDDANRNFDSGMVSNGVRAILDFEARYVTESGTDFGVFARGAGWYDEKISGATNDNDLPVTVNSGPLYGSMPAHNVFHPDVEDRSGRGTELLDLFFYTNLLNQTNHPVTVRVGRQVINWGESAFIQNGLSSVINPADVSKAVLPGTEVKEILRPLGAAFGSVQLTDTLSLQGYYQWEWESTIAPPYGTFLSPVPDPLAGTGGETFLAPVALVAGQLPFPQDPQYYSLPFSPLNRLADQEASDSGQWGLALNWYLPDFGDAELGFYAGNYHRKRPTIVLRNFGGEVQHDWIGECIAGAGPAAQACIPLSVVLTGFDRASYQLDYLEDVEYYGFSWNSMLNFIETAFSGEVIYHRAVPLQTRPLLPSVVGTVLPGLPPPIGGGIQATTPIFSREDMIVTQFTFNKNVNWKGFSDDNSLIVEFGWIHVQDLDDGQIWSGNTPADQDSFGYRLVWSSTWYDGLGKMIDALSGTNLIWSVNFAHDFSGTSPVVGSGFVDGAMAFATAIEAEWQNRWSVKLGYTNFFGDGTDTLGRELNDHVLGDRDFVDIAVKFRF